jgi:hypothetical protein
MKQDERGRWFRVYARQIRDHDKFRNLNVVELGAWTALRSEAELRDRAIIPDRAEAVLLLRRRRTPRPSSVFDRLVDLRLFDVDEDGRVTVHDRKDHDRPEYPSDDPEKVRERVRRHRQKGEGNDSNEDGNDSLQNSNETHAGALLGLGADSASNSDSEGGPGGLPEGWDAPDAIVAYHEVTHRYPSQAVTDWLNRMSDDHPEEAIAATLAKCYADDPNLGTLLSRTDAALKLDQHRRNKANQRARDKARANIEAPFRKQEREATPEERERAKLQQQAIRLGLQLGLQVPTDPEEVRKFVMKHGSAA